ncbi:hypothetical protein [Micromonospora sp. NPDC047134]|uniref:hypothetical protein n=1 Tax=Micromonospora sp. NPDC047134 TaxID=3154340 RepID=UPI0033CC75C5
MRKLWFDLRATLRQAEDTITGQTEPLEPWLVLDVDTARLWCTPFDAPRPRSTPVAATHTDGPPPAAGPWPLRRQPLTTPDTDGGILQRLRAAARQGHRWLVVETSAPTRLTTAVAYDTDTPAHHAVWTPAWLTTGDLGPYPGQTAHGYQHHGHLIARFQAETVQRIAADTNARTLRRGWWDGDLLVQRGHGSGMEMFVVGAPTAGLAPDSLVVPISADSDGWYRLVGDRWPWRQATPPDPDDRCHGSGPEVFAPDGPDGIRCTVCAATGYDIAYQELPSMAGHGTDTTMSCRICGSSDSLTEEIGWNSRRVIWPPLLDLTPTADSKAARP